MTTRTLRAAAACALLATTCLVAPAKAQSIASAYPNVDANGVDLTDGSFNFSLVEGSIGSGEGALSLVRFGAGGSSLDNWSGLYLHQDRAGSGTVMTVALGNRSESFTKEASGSFTARQGNGATLTGSDRNYVYRSADGTTIAFGPPVSGEDLDGFQGCNDSNFANCRLPALSVAEPSGKTTTLSYDVHRYVERTTSGPGPDTPRTEGEGTPGEPAPISNSRFFWRLKTVSNNFGYAMDVTYLEGGIVNNQASPDWFRRSGASFRNAALGTGNLSQVSYASEGNVLTITTAMDRKWRITTDDSKRIVAIKRPGAAADSNSTTIAYGASGVTQVTVDGVTTSYSRTVSGAAATTQVTDALQHSRTIVSDLAIGRPTLVTDEVGEITSLAYDASGRLTEVTAPEGNKVLTNYDARGNAHTTVLRAKSGSGLTDIATTVGYHAECTNILTCNQPVWTKDAAGNLTEYSYNEDTGLIAAVTAPAAPNGIRPQTRYAYSVVNGISMLVGTSTCQTLASCAGEAQKADEVITSVVYGANNLPTSVSQGAGDGSLTATQTMSYDAVGNLIAIDGPLDGAADTTRARYNAAREVVGLIGPDPDGAERLKPRAVRTSRNADGQVTAEERGTVADASEKAWAEFSVLEQVNATYNANGQVVKQTLGASGSTHAAVEYSYDAEGRVDCTAQRMNPANFGALTNACTLGTAGSFGPDRISRTVYDAADRVVQTQVAVSTPEAANEASSSYTANGKLATLTDGENNRTTYGYDGHDRLLKMIYPSAAKGAGSSNDSNYEQLSYDPRSLVTARRLRDGNTIGYGYDALGRLTSKDLPNIAPHEYDLTFGYDNLGRLTNANEAHYRITHGYDALGRHLFESSDTFGKLGSQYDIAGRRTRLTHPDGFFVSYDYLTTGEMTAIRERGAASGVGVLATFGYDDRGQRTSLVRGNGTSTTYAYDPVSRLSQLTQNLAGDTNDLNTSFGYNVASQIVSTTRDNDVFSFNAHTSGTIIAAANGLNQLMTVGSASLTYDGQGNLTNDGAGRAFAYTGENRLAGSNGIELAHDPMGRNHYVSGSQQRWHVYDGTELNLEYAPINTIARRYVHGPGIDEPLVAYEGSGTNDRRFLHADERGSIVALSDNAGSVSAINKYDEYGKPQGALTGRFGYTGQAWLPEVGVYNYKARMYDPGLGRFLQTDPIGYEDGMNLYGYVGGDPVNFRDPSGTCTAGEVRVKEGGGPGRYEGDTIVVQAARFRCVRLASQDGGIGSSSLGGGKRRAKSQDIIRNIIVTARKIYCSLPSIGGGVTAGGYAGFGGGVSLDAAFDPQTGRLGISAGLNVGVGVGFSVNGNGSLSGGRSVANGVSASVGVNASVRGPGARVGVAGTLIDSKGFNPSFNGVSAGPAPGIGATANANLTVRGSAGGKVLPSCH